MVTKCFYLFTASQIHQVEFATEFLLRLSVLLFDVYQEDAVTPWAVLIHVYKETNECHEVKNVIVTTKVVLKRAQGKGKLTCNCDMSVGFAFINSVHNFLRTADEPLSAALCGEIQSI